MSLLPYIDINECALGIDTCAQTCNNTVGSYICHCRIGYRLNPDGRVCDGNFLCWCMHAGQGLYRPKKIMECSLHADINECVEGGDQCSQNCHNTLGSYNCSCNPGYRLNMNEFGCDDINECTEMTDRCDQNCRNNIGSYACSCNTGYRLNQDSFRCDGKCSNRVATTAQNTIFEIVISTQCN